MFDGQNIWVAGATSNTLSEYSIDGKQLAGPISLTSGGWPVGMASDGANLWITEFDINKVCKVSESAPSAGTCFATGNSPYFDAFDGKYVWVVNTGDNTVEAFLATNPATHYTYATGSGPTGVAFDGKCIWVTNTNDNPGTVTVINPPAGACTLSGTHALGVANQYLQPFSIAYDGQVMWVAYRGTPFAGPGGVVEVTTARFTTPHAFQCNPGWGTGTVVFDGAYIRVAGGTTGVCKSESSLFANPVAVNKYSNGINANQLALGTGSSVSGGGSRADRKVLAVVSMPSHGRRDHSKSKARPLSVAGLFYGARLAIKLGRSFPNGSRPTSANRGGLLTRRRALWGRRSAFGALVGRSPFGRMMWISDLNANDLG